ncbi:MAG: response regulator [Gemmatimonadales bacterium]
MLSQREVLYETIVDSLGGIVWEADGSTFQFSFVSPRAEELLGYPASQWLEQPDFWAAHTHPDDRAWCAAFCLDATAQRRDHQFEYRMLAADGRVVWLHDIVTVKSMPDGSVRLWGIMIDITARKLAEQHLEDRRGFELLVSELSATFAALRPTELDPAIAAWLERLSEYLDVERGTFLELSDDGLTLETRQSYTAPSETPLPVTVVNRDFPWFTSRMLQGNPVRLACAVDDLPPEAVAEREFCRQYGIKSHLSIPISVGGAVLCIMAFTSLRAFRTWPDEIVKRLRLVGEIFAGGISRQRMAALRQRFEAERGGLLPRLHEIIACLPVGCVLTDPALRITDLNPAGQTLLGFRPDDDVVLTPLETLVAPASRAEFTDGFERLDRETLINGVTDNLTKDRRIVPCEWSRVALRNADGTLAGFFGMFHPAPAEAAAGPGGSGHQGRAAATKPVTLLVVDDEDSVRSVVRRVLEREGYRIHEARSGGEALEFMASRGEQIDLVLMDVLLPEMDGSDLAERLRDRDPGTRILFLSGYQKDHFPHLTPGIGQSPFLQKPFTTEALLRAIRDALA